MAQDLIAASVKLSKMLNRKELGELGKVTFTKVDDILKSVDKVIDKYMLTVKKEILREVHERIDSSMPAESHKYAYIDTEGNLVRSHTSSGIEGSAPVSFTGKLKNSIECIIDKENDRISVGVSNQAGNSIGTAYYIPLNKIYKRSPIRNKLLALKDQGYRGAIVLGDHQTPVREYATYLEKGWTVKGTFHSRPFITSSVQDAIEFSKKFFSDEMKDLIKRRTGKPIVSQVRFTVNT
jgi:hypothetical protein